MSGTRRLPVAPASCRPSRRVRGGSRRDGGATVSGRPPGWRRRLRRLAKATAALVFAAVAAFAVLWVAFPFPLDRFDAQPASTLILDTEGHIIRGTVAGDDSWRFPVEWERLSPWLIQATVAVEDGRFFSHHGVDGRAVLRAVAQNVSRGRVVSGASTITMQVVRMMDNRPRTVWSKAVESFRALQLERLRSKREILCAYLNRAPYGSNLRGAEAASLRYFGKRSADLTLAEAALLAGLPQAPSRYRPDRHLERAMTRQRFVLSEMRRRGVPAQFDEATAQPVQVGVEGKRWKRRLRPLPVRAPHLCDMVIARAAGGRRIRTTVDLGIQSVAEGALRRQVARLADRDVSNGAVVVIENRTGAVRALVGSADYSHPQHGQVNAAVARRSPGSALKPFTYALAFDAGLCTPSTVLADIPIRFACYRPENYDRVFRGPVAARTALADSLNIPALRLANELGAGRLRQVLTESGIRTLGRPTGHYGLSLTLGSCEVRLLEVTNAYACLARLGEYRPYRLTEEEPIGRARRVVSTGAAFLVAHCLSDRERLERAAGVARTDSLPTIAWKTGTSTGRRDAWTVAYNPDYTVGVWLGNFDGHGSEALVGVEAAAPVAFEIVRELHRDRPWRWYDPPPDVAVREVCPVSGEPVGPDCPTRQEAHYLPGRSAVRPCSIHRRILVDTDTGHRLCPLCASTPRRGWRAGAGDAAVRGACPRTEEPPARPCASTRRARWQVATVYPPAVAHWLTANGQAPPPLPRHWPGCPALFGEGRLVILSPAEGARFAWMPDRPAADQQVALRAAAPSGSSTLYWFVEGQLVARCRPTAVAQWPLTAGRHELRCVDDRGRRDSVHVWVE